MVFINVVRARAKLIVTAKALVSCLFVNRFGAGVKRACIGGDCGEIEHQSQGSPHLGGAPGGIVVLRSLPRAYEVGGGALFWDENRT